MLISLFLYESNETEIAPFASKAKLYGIAGIQLTEKSDIDKAINDNNKSNELF